MRKKTILINYTGRRGGGPLDALEMAKALLEKGCTVAAIIAEDVENLSSWEKLPFVRLVRIKTYTSIKSFFLNSIKFFFIRRKLLEKSFKDIRIDVIYVPMLSFWTGMINSCFKGVRTIVVNHDPLPHSGGKFLWSIGQGEFKKADCIVVHSRAFIDYAGKKFKKPVEYFKLGRHSHYLSLSSADAITRYPKDKINFLFFGTISKYKGLGVLAESYKAVVREVPDVTLTVAGSGDFTEYRKAYSDLPNFTLINRWIGDDEISGLFSGENIVVVLPYLDATQSGAVLVGLEFGLPVIATDTGGISEQIKDGVTGVLVKPGDADSLTAAMLKLAMDKPLRDKLAQAARESLVDFEWSDSADALTRIIDTL